MSLLGNRFAAMRENVFLGNIRRTDLIFRLFRHLPRPLRNWLIEQYVHQARKQSAGGNRPARLTLFVTNQCNMRCSHCFIVRETQPKTEQLTLDEYRRVFAGVCGSVSQILVTGGEPTLRKDFADIVVAAATAGRVPTANIFSNGLQTDKLIKGLESILERCDIQLNYQTSIDGLREFHDGNRRVAGAFEQAFHSISQVRELARRNPRRFGRIVVATAISGRNLGSLEQICDMAMQSGVSPAFTFVRTSNDVFNLADSSLRSDLAPEATKSDGSAKFSEGDYLTADEMDWALKVIDRKIWNRDRGRLSFCYNRTTLETIRASKASGSSPFSRECRMGYDDLVVLADGAVSRCEMLAARVNLRDFDFDIPRLLDSPQWKACLASSLGCWCTHDCGIGVSMMKEANLLKKLC
jgi:sulfatase maturation enzyme AslB (radical SAM superfamily)